MVRIKANQRQESISCTKQASLIWAMKDEEINLWEYKDPVENRPEIGLQGRETADASAILNCAIPLIAMLLR